MLLPFWQFTERQKISQRLVQQTFKLAIGLNIYSIPLDSEVGALFPCDAGNFCSDIRCEENIVAQLPG